MKSFKVGLPGTLYRKNARWWWKVKLPGDTRLTDMGLKAKGARFATTDRPEGEEIAVGIWNAAIRKEVQAQVRVKAREKAKDVAKEMATVESEAAQTVANLKAKIVEMIANAKAECDKKLQQSDELTAQADQRVQAESQKKAELEAEYENKLERCNDALAQANERIQAEAEKRAAVEAEYENKLTQCNDTLAQAQERVNTEAEARMQAEAKLDEFAAGMKITATCDCCGKGDVPEDELSTIDSGHRLCSDCMGSLRG